MKLRKKWIMRIRQGLLLLLLAGAAVMAWQMGGDRAAVPPEDYIAARATTRKFRRTVLRTGLIVPLREERITTKVIGTISFMAEEGALVNKDDVVLKIDPSPHIEAKLVQEALMSFAAAGYQRDLQESLMLLNQAKQNVESQKLRLELEQTRLGELKKGPEEKDIVNARVTLENNKLLQAAKDEETQVIEGLAAGGFASAEEARTKRFEAAEAFLKVVEAEIAMKKLLDPDKVREAEQELKVRDAEKILNAASEKAELLERTIKRNTEVYEKKSERDKERLADLVKNIEACTIKSPAYGVVVHRRNWGHKISPGMSVYEGQEIIAIPDLSEMKIRLSVDEARISQIAEGQSAEIMPAGWTGVPFKGKITRVAEKGRDEFELYSTNTTALTGTANRQVFDVEVSVDVATTLKERESVLRPGLRADVEIVVEDLGPQVTVPRMAVRHREKQNFITLKHAGQIEEREIKLKGENSFYAAVEGVQDGDQVLLIKQANKELPGAEQALAVSTGDKPQVRESTVKAPDKK